MVIDKLKKYLENIPPDRDPSKVGLSSVGHCSRQLAYRVHGYKGIPLSWKSQSIFDDGDLFHNQLRGWMKTAGVEIFNEEDAVVVPTPKGRRIVGHIDGLVTHEGETLLLEIKSMSSYGFERLLKGEPIDESYRAQMSGYMLGLDIDRALFVAKCKDNSDLHEVIYEIDRPLIEEKLRKLDLVLDSTTPDMVERTYGPLGKGLKLDWHCGYCAFWKECWKDRNPIEKEAHKVYLTEEKK